MSSLQKLWLLKANQIATTSRKSVEFRYQISLGESVRDFNMHLSPTFSIEFKTESNKMKCKLPITSIEPLVKKKKKKN